MKIICFISNNEEVEEIVAEADQMFAEADNEEKVEIEIVDEKVDEFIVDILSVAYTESDNEEKNYKVCNTV